MIALHAAPVKCNAISQHGFRFNTSSHHLRLYCPSINSIMQSHARIVGNLMRSYRTSLISLKDFTRGFAADVVNGLNVNKGGVDPPVKPDEEYPEWLWQLSQPERTLGDLRRLNKAGLDFNDLKKLEKLKNRSQIRETNVKKAK